MSKAFKAKIITLGVTGSYEVRVTATNSFQAKQIIETQHGKVRTWVSGPVEVR